MSAQYESMAKRMQHGFAARNGLFAALMSRENYTGIDQVFERPYGGYLSTFGQGSTYDPTYKENELIGGLRRDWRGIEGIRLKEYNSMIATHAPVDCIATLQAKQPERFADLGSVSKIVIEQPKAPHAHGDQQIDRPITTTGAQMSTRYIAAVQLLDRKVLLEQFSEANLERDDTWDLLRMIDCVWNEEFDEKSAWYTRVSVEFTDGESWVQEMPVLKAIGSLVSGCGIKEKWRVICPPARPEIHFVANRSGSMVNEIPMLISALKVFLKSLPVGVNFKICSFGSTHSFLWPKSRSYDNDSLKEAIAHVEHFKADYCGTETQNTVRAAIDSRFVDLDCEILVLTDGDICRQHEIVSYLNDTVGDSIHVFPLGIGDGVSTSLVEGVARAGKGFARMVGEGEKLDKKKWFVCWRQHCLRTSQTTLWSSGTRNLQKKRVT